MRKPRAEEAGKELSGAADVEINCCDSGWAFI